MLLGQACLGQAAFLELLRLRAGRSAIVAPNSPESAFGNAILGPVLATIDRVRDATHHEPGGSDRRL